MPASHGDLWQRIAAYDFDREADTVTFVDKLCRENGWSGAHAERALEEYRRFAFLAMTAGHRVSPSDAVDQVWHQHLMYTRRYWDDFCAKVLGGPLHHEPATGREGERAGLGDDYARTLASYRTHFGAPPADLWPDRPDARAGSHRRVDLRANVVLPRRVALLVGSTLSLLAAGVGAVVAGGILSAK